MTSSSRKYDDAAENCWGGPTLRTFFGYLGRVPEWKLLKKLPVNSGTNRFNFNEPKWNIWFVLFNLKALKQSVWKLSCSILVHQIQMCELLVHFRAPNEMCDLFVHFNAPNEMCDLFVHFKNTKLKCLIVHFKTPN